MMFGKLFLLSGPFSHLVGRDARGVSLTALVREARCPSFPTVCMGHLSKRRPWYPSCRIRMLQSWKSSLSSLSFNHSILGGSLPVTQEFCPCFSHISHVSVLSSSRKPQPPSARYWGHKVLCDRFHQVAQSLAAPVPPLSEVSQKCVSLPLPFIWPMSLSLVAPLIFTKGLSF